MLINWICHTKPDWDSYLYTRNLLNECLKPGFEYKITFWICILGLWIHKGYYVVKKLVWNVRIKAFWYTKILILDKVKIFMVKLSKSCFFEMLNSSQQMGHSRWTQTLTGGWYYRLWTFLGLKQIWKKVDCCFLVQKLFSFPGRIQEKFCIVPGSQKQTEISKCWYHRIDCYI